MLLPNDVIVILRWFTRDVALLFVPEVQVRLQSVLVIVFSVFLSIDSI